MAEQKLGVEEKMQLNTTLSKLDALGKKAVMNNIIMERKNRVIEVIRYSIPDLALNLQSIQKIENEIHELTTDELTDDLYDTVIWEKVKNYIENSNNRFMKQEFMMQLLLDFLIDIFDAINDSVVQRPKQNFSPEISTLDEEERQSFKTIMHTKVLYYKEANATRRKIFLHNIMGECDTEEKRLIADDLFFELVGERVLKKHIESKKKKKEEEKDAEG